MAPFVKFTDKSGKTPHEQCVNAEYIVKATFIPDKDQQTADESLLALTIDSNEAGARETVKLHGKDARDAWAILQKL